MKVMVKYFFLADIFFLGVILDFNKRFFLLQMCFFFVGGRRLS